jgi:hypothetical protein
MAKAKKSIATVGKIAKAIDKAGRDYYVTPRSLWSRRLRQERKFYRRHFVRKDAAYHGGDLDRDYEKSRDIEKIVTDRVYRRYQMELMKELGLERWYW